MYQGRTWDEFKRVLSVAHASQPVEGAENLEYRNQLSGLCWGAVYCSIESIFFNHPVHIVFLAWLFARSISKTIRRISIKFSIGGSIVGGRVYHIHTRKLYVPMRNSYSLPEHTVSTLIPIWILPPKFRSTTPCHNIKRTAQHDIIALSSGRLAEISAYHLNASD